MSNKLIDLNALSEYKDYSDLKYQDKLTAGSGISLNGTTISASSKASTYGVARSSGSVSVAKNTLTNVGSFTLQPGRYLVQYNCQFATNANGGYRQCGISINTTAIDGLGDFGWDSRAVASGIDTQTRVTVVIDVSASDYPNGRTFYLLARHNSTASITVYPRCYYLKF